MCVCVWLNTLNIIITIIIILLLFLLSVMYTKNAILTIQNKTKSRKKKNYHSCTFYEGCVVYVCTEQCKIHRRVWSYIICDISRYAYSCACVYVNGQDFRLERAKQS